MSPSAKAATCRRTPKANAPKRRGVAVGKNRWTKNLAGQKVAPVKNIGTAKWWFNEPLDKVNERTHKRIDTPVDKE
jgi:hypothetical protein